jgi:hypothetical protein
MNGESKPQKPSSALVEDDDVIPEEVTEALLAWLEADALADDFDEPIEPITAEEAATGQAGLDAYRNAPTRLACKKSLHHRQCD